MANFAHGRHFISTDPAGFSDNRFAQHFEPLFLALSPLVIWNHGLEVIFGLQALSVFLAAIFSGLAMENILNHKFGYWVGVIGVCLHPAAGFPLWFDFHGDVFSLLPISIMLWAMTKNDWKVFSLAFPGSLACIEYSLVATSGIALMMVYQAGKENPILKRRGLLLLFVSMALMGLILFVLMPPFRNPGAISVLMNHLKVFTDPANQPGDTESFGAISKVFFAIFNRFNLANLLQALIPLSPVFLFSPVTLLGALPNCIKDMCFGFDIGSHHFAPAIPVLYVGLAFAMRNSLPSRRHGQALLLAFFCAILGAALWGPSPIGRQGWKVMAATPRLGNKVPDLNSAFRSDRPRLLTGQLGSILFDSPRLYFLGSTSVPITEFDTVTVADVFLELWDQGFSGWAPMGRMQDHLNRFLARRKASLWKEVAPGTLQLQSESYALQNSTDSVLLCLSEPDSLAQDSEIERLSVSNFKNWQNLDSTLSYAIVGFRKDGTAMPMGFKCPGRPWLFFKIQTIKTWRSRMVLQLRGLKYSDSEMAASKYWPILESLDSGLLR